MFDADLRYVEEESAKHWRKNSREAEAAATAPMPPRSDTLGAVLAGGLARRMGGGDKPLRLLAGRPLLRHVLDRMAPQVAAVVLNANGDPARFADYAPCRWCRTGCRTIRGRSPACSRRWTGRRSGGPTCPGC